MRVWSRFLISSYSRKANLVFETLCFCNNYQAFDLQTGKRLIWSNSASINNNLAHSRPWYPQQFKLMLVEAKYMRNNLDNAFPPFRMQITTIFPHYIISDLRRKQGYLIHFSVSKAIIQSKEIYKNIPTSFFNHLWYMYGGEH